jgi:rubrerythrin
MATAKKSGKTAIKKTAVKTTAKKTMAKKTAKKSAGMKKGSKYACGVCGLSVTVDTACGCAETACLICCEKPMKMKR